MRATIVCALLMLAPAAATAEAYKCKLPNGKTSFQDQPCESGAKGEAMILSDPSPPSDTPAPAPTLKGKVRPARQDKIPDAQKGKADDALKERNRQLEAQNRAMACSMARRNLNVLRTQRPVYHTDKNGNKQYVEDANRQSEIQAAQQEVAENCK